MNICAYFVYLTYKMVFVYSEKFYSCSTTENKKYFNV